MLKYDTWLWALLWVVSSGLVPAENSGNPSGQAAPVDTITPVPPPKIGFASPESGNLEAPKNLNINNGGGTISGDAQSGIRFGGPVKITGDNGLEIFARTARLDTQAKTVTLEGDVCVYQGNIVQRGDTAIYHYDEKRLESTGLRASIDPILLESGKFTAQKEGDRQVYIGHDAGITTQDVEDPNYWFRAKETRIYPGEKVVFNDLHVYAGDTPVFWFPYLSQPLDSELGYHFLPGSKTAWGPFLLNTYGLMLGGERDPETGMTHDAWLLSRWHFDLRATRGLGAGVDLLEKKNARDKELTGLGLYYLYDLNPKYSRSGLPRTFSDPERYKIQLKQRFGLDTTDDADWRVDSNLTYLSDQYYLEDFEQDRYRKDPAPDNTIGIIRRSDSTLLSMFGRFQVNDFYRADTRLPEIALDIARAPLFGLPILHEGTASIGLIGERSADITRTSIINPLRSLTMGNPALQLLSQLSGYERQLAEAMVRLPLGDPRRDELSQQLLDASYARFHAYEQFSMPTTIGDFLTLTPEAGLGYTRYGAVDGPVDGFGRTHMHVGTEASLKFSKDLSDYQNHDLGIDGLQHIFQPYTGWSLVSTNDFEPGEPGVDRLTPSTRPRELDPIRFTALDQMESWNVIRMGGRNRLVTRRDNQSFEWLYVDTYVDTFLNDPEGTRDVSNLYNDVRWRPTPWMDWDFETQFPVASGGSGFSEYASRARFLPSQDFEFSIGYRWLKGHPYLLDSSQVDFRTYTRLTQEWGIGTRHSVELDDGTLEYQQYTMHRDLGNWVAGMGFTVRDNRLKQEYGVIFTLTLKDFPSITLPFEYDGQ